MPNDIGMLVCEISDYFDFSVKDAEYIVGGMLAHNYKWTTPDELRRECFKYAQRLVNGKINEVKT